MLLLWLLLPRWPLIQLPLRLLLSIFLLRFDLALALAFALTPALASALAPDPLMQIRFVFKGKG